MGKLINIDNGGTLTDVCVVDGTRIHHVKTLTTPYDLSKCLFEGLKEAATLVYGEADVGRLLLETECLRYSTTQGTNALVERKGPRVGLVVAHQGAVSSLTVEPAQRALIQDLVDNRIGHLNPHLPEEQFDRVAIAVANELASAGANRLVVSLDCDGYAVVEARLRRLFLRSFPTHLLGAIPVLFGTDASPDPDYARRTWTALFNAFLHPPMERFLYSAEHRLRAWRTRAPLLVFRNDGGSARVAKTMAIRTYSSGPRGGLEGVRAMATHLGLPRVLSYDIGGTTTDVGLVEEGAIRAQRHGRVEGVAVSFPLCEIYSAGVGGSSIIRAEGRALRVGPESVGAAPGPACFGFGGREATITDAFLLAGVLDADGFFGGNLKLDRTRAHTAVASRIAEPLGIDVDTAVVEMERAWVARVVEALGHFGPPREDTVLAAFGGAGALAVTAIAAGAGVSRVLIPARAAVFSAFGIAFSDLAHDYELPLPAPTAEALEAAFAQLCERARRDMFGEGVALEDCTMTAELIERRNGEQKHTPLAEAVLAQDSGADVRLALHVARRLARPELPPADAGTAHPARPAARRRVLIAGYGWQELPVYRFHEQRGGAVAAGPAIIEAPYLTGRIDAGWELRTTGGGDLMLQRQ